MTHKCAYVLDDYTVNDVEKKGLSSHPIYKWIYRAGEWKVASLDDNKNAKAIIFRDGVDFFNLDKMKSKKERSYTFYYEEPVPPLEAFQIPRPHLFWWQNLSTQKPNGEFKTIAISPAVMTPRKFVMNMYGDYDGSKEFQDPNTEYALAAFQLKQDIMANPDAYDRVVNLVCNSHPLPEEDRKYWLQMTNVAMLAIQYQYKITIDQLNLLDILNNQDIPVIANVAMGDPIELEKKS